MIDQSRQQVAQTVNAALVRLYWSIGKRIREDVLNEQRAEYGEQIVSSLMTQLSWTHLIYIISFDDPLQREFYAEMCDEDRMTPDLVFRDPYFLDFLGLSDTYSESDLEQAILRELESFLLELGTDFAFVTRQKRMVVNGEDFYLDLLFYHRRLRRLVAIDLKLGRFQPADKGQMELYLRWLEEYEMQPGEETPIGLILCADKSEERVRLLQLEESGIRVARYLTELPERKVLERKLRESIRLARQHLVHRTLDSEH